MRLLSLPLLLFPLAILAWRLAHGALAIYTAGLIELVKW
jgi:hypothetical protein